MSASNNLADLLSAYWLNLQARRSGIAAEYETIIGRLEGADAGRTAPQVGAELPAFQLPDHRNRLVSSADCRKRGPLVVSLNRGHWCGFCRRELKALQDIVDEVESLGASVVAITPDRQKFAKRIKQEFGLTFPVLCDIDNGYALSLGLAIWCGQNLKPIYAEFDIDLEVYHGNPGWILPIPATYVVDQNGVIAGRFVDADFRRRMEPAEILELLRSLQANSADAS